MKEKLFEYINTKLDIAMRFLMENGEIQTMKNLIGKSEEISSGYTMSAFIEKNLEGKNSSTQRHIRDILEIFIGMDDNIVSFVKDVTDNIEKEAVSRLEKSGTAPHRINYIKRSRDGVAGDEKFRFRHVFAKEIKDHTLTKIDEYLKLQLDKENTLDEAVESKKEGYEINGSNSTKVKKEGFNEFYPSKRAQENSDLEVATSITNDQLRYEHAKLREFILQHHGQEILSKIVAVSNTVSPKNTPGAPLSGNNMIDNTIGKGSTIKG